jgi:nitroimidazol reductase NimA-like FMN-containing flavoprotein (pyridoxamine 5'-phosphate oxidase superfamily)
MPGAESVAMDDDERDEFLGTGGNGVISLSTADDAPPHSVPVSYGYDPVESVFYFRLAVGPDSEKGSLDDRAASVVIHGQSDGAYRSVVARGRLTRTTDEAVATEALEGLERVRIPFVDIFGRPPSEVEFGFFRLVPDRLTGRKESPTRI